MPVMSESCKQCRNTIYYNDNKYEYWKNKGKLKKKYIGKTWDDWLNRGIAKDAQVEPKIIRKQ